MLSRDDNYADALSGNALAAQKGGPLLLTGTTGLDRRVAVELQKILPAGSTVYVLGGTSALSPQVVKDLTALHYTVSRLSGATRFDTSVAVAKAVSAHPHTVMVATGLNAPDTLSGGASIATQHGPLLLVDGPNVPAGVTAWAKAHGAQLTHLLVFGGENAVPGSAAKSVATDAWGTSWTNELQ